jgi:pimeloyl-ACP methyl ester carboxylesterase
VPSAGRRAWPAAGWPDFADRRSVSHSRRHGRHVRVPTLTYTRTGSGQPLVLLHALGLSRSAWDPVVPVLSQHFDVIGVDLPGFGASAPLPAHVEPTPAALAEAVAALLAELGVTTAHVAGNSLGGWVALELAALTPVASLTLLAPAGLWRDQTPIYCRASHTLACAPRREATGRTRPHPPRPRSRLRSVRRSPHAADPGLRRHCGARDR